MLLSSIPPYCIVAPNREIMNKYSFTPLAMFSLNNTNNVLENINIDDSRGRSNAVSRTSSIAYSKQIEIQSDDMNWANQTNIELFKVSFSSQARRESKN